MISPATVTVDPPLLHPPFSCTLAMSEAIDSTAPRAARPAALRETSSPP
jgi:hypothetical protein